MKTLISFLGINSLISLFFKDCLFGHKWEYSMEDVPLTSLDGTHKTKIKCPTRFCEKCYTKEVRGMREWVKYNRYSKEQAREINLNRILGK